MKSNSTLYPHIRGHFPKWYDMVSSKISMPLWSKMYNKHLPKFYNISDALKMITDFTNVESIR